MTPDLASHLGGHHGVVTRVQTAALGLSRDELSGLVRRGELVRVHRGVYRHAAVAVTFEQRIEAALAAAGRHAVVSHRTALALLGVRNFDCHLVELTMRSSSVPAHRGIVVHRSRLLPATHVTRRGGWWVTTPARTLADCAGVMAPRLVARFAEQMMADRRLPPNDLSDVLAALAGRPGIPDLARELRDSVPDADSVAEAHLGSLLVRAGLPPVLHHLVTTSTGLTYELDWAYPRARVALEMDGYGVHLRSVVAFDEDRFRRNELEIDEWRVLNFTRRMCRNRPGVVVDQVRRALCASTCAP